MGQISETGIKILHEKKYLKENEKEWEDIVNRVSKAIGSAETDPEKAKSVTNDVWTALMNMEFVFSSPCLLNADIEKPGQLSSCFVVDVKDTIESISRCDGNFAKIFQRNGGAGTDLSVLRPAKSRVQNTNGYSCGPVGFAHKFNVTADIMTRNNPTKRGALKLNLAVWHPDIIEFIHCKDDEGVLSFMNISVSLYDNFMIACRNDDDWNLEFPDLEWNKEIYNNEWDGDLQLWKDKGYPTIIYKTMKARELMYKIAYCGWRRGEPGVNYQTTMNNANMNTHLGRQVFTNPCNEFTNIPYSSCNLGSINLVEMFNSGIFDWDKFKHFVDNTVRWIDNMITLNKLPLPEIQEMTEKIRPIGLGVMGFADALYKMGIKYNSQRGLQFADYLFEQMKIIAIDASHNLALEKGEYPAWKGSRWDKEQTRLMRNSCVLSIAPTGTISTFAGVSGSIEPNFGLVYTRTTNNGTKYYVVNPIFEEELRRRGLYSEELLEKIDNNHGSCVGLDEVPMDIQEVFVTAHDVSPADHLEMLSVIQKHVDLAISKTINLSHTASVEEVEDVIIKGWEKGAKGLTVYRDGSRESQTLSTASTYKKEEEKISVSIPTKKFNRRKDLGRKLPGNTYAAESACGTFFLTINKNPENGQVAESFINFKKGLCKANMDALNRMISLSLQRGIPAEDVIDKLQGITCSACTRVKYKNEKEIDGISCPDIISKLLQLECDNTVNTQLIGDSIMSVDVSNKDNEQLSDIKPMIPMILTTQGLEDLEQMGKSKIDIIESVEQNKCPECGAKLLHASGCIECVCGWTKC